MVWHTTVQYVLHQILSHYTPDVLIGAPEAFDSYDTLGASDIWSLGCVFLEFIVWYVSGIEALQQFQEQTPKRKMRPGDCSHSGYHSGHKLDSRVKARYRSLSEEIATGHEVISDLLAIVEHHMLQINPKRRLSAKKLSRCQIQIMQEAEQARSVMSLQTLYGACNRKAGSTLIKFHSVCNWTRQKRKTLIQPFFRVLL